MCYSHAVTFVTLCPVLLSPARSPPMPRLPRTPRDLAPTGPHTTVALALDAIVIDDAIQPRVSLDSKIIAEYTELYRTVRGTDDDPDILPPLKIMTVDGSHLMTDGFHRHEAALQAGRTMLRCVLSAGTRQDAIREAALANIKHGLPYTRQDKERVLERLLDDPIYGVKSTRELAAELGISHMTVQRFKDRRQAVQTILQTAPDIITLAKEVGIIEDDQLAVLAQETLAVPTLVAEVVKRVVHDPETGPQETIVPKARARLKEDLRWKVKLTTMTRQEQEKTAAKRRAAQSPEARAARQAEKE